MIKYALRCADGHEFESWFQSADAFDVLQTQGLLACPTCGVSQVEKALMAPKLSNVPAVAKSAAPMTKEQAMQKALAELKSEVEKNSDYVGDRFAEEARAMHLDEAPARPIHGEAKADDARALVEDGVPILPLPFRSKRQTN